MLSTHPQQPLTATSKPEGSSWIGYHNKKIQPSSNGEQIHHYPFLSISVKASTCGSGTAIPQRSKKDEKRTRNAPAGSSPCENNVTHQALPLHTPLYTESKPIVARDLIHTRGPRARPPGEQIAACPARENVSRSSSETMQTPAHAAA